MIAPTSFVLAWPRGNNYIPGRIASRCNAQSIGISERGERCWAKSRRCNLRNGYTYMYVHVYTQSAARSGVLFTEWTNRFCSPLKFDIPSRATVRASCRENGWIDIQEETIANGSRLAARDLARIEWNYTIRRTNFPYDILRLRMYTLSCRSRYLHARLPCHTPICT